MATYLTESQFYKYCGSVSRFLNENRPLRGWAVHSGSTYKAEQTGSVTVLYQNGTDLGAAEATLVAVDTNGEWFYDATINTTYLFNDANSPNLDDIQAGEDHATYVADIFQRASLLIDRELDATHVIPIPADGDGNYEELIIQLTAYKTAELITVVDAPELAALYRGLLTNETDTGLLDRLKKGILKFAYEIDATSSSGEITEITLTGTIRLIELRGRASGIAWDNIKITIITGGAIGTATYSTWVMDSDNNTLQTLAQEVEEIIDGGFQHLGHGVYGRFAGTSATSDDEWAVEVRGDSEEISNPHIKPIFGHR